MKLNKQAEAEVERLVREGGQTAALSEEEYLEFIVRAAMAWAYRDAADVCRGLDSGLPNNEYVEMEIAARSIEARIKSVPVKNRTS